MEFPLTGLLLLFYAISGDACVTFNFEEGFETFDPTLGTVCETVNNNWSLRQYSSSSVDPPHPRSETHISSVAATSCVSSFFFDIENGGEVEVSIYMLSNEFVTIEINNEAGEQVATWTSVANPITNEWTKVNLTVSTASIEPVRGYLSLFAMVTADDTILVDSFRYIPPGMDADSIECAIYVDDNEATEPSTTENYVTTEASSTEDDSGTTESEIATEAPTTENVSGTTENDIPTEPSTTENNVTTEASSTEDDSGTTESEIATEAPTTENVSGTTENDVSTEPSTTENYVTTEASSTEDDSGTTESEIATEAPTTENVSGTTENEVPIETSTTENYVTTEAPSTEDDSGTTESEIATEAPTTENVSGTTENEVPTETSTTENDDITNTSTTENGITTDKTTDSNDVTTTTDNYTTESTSTEPNSGEETTDRPDVENEDIFWTPLMITLVTTGSFLVLLLIIYVSYWCGKRREKNKIPKILYLDIEDIPKPIIPRVKKLYTDSLSSSNPYAKDYNR